MNPLCVDELCKRRRACAHLGPEGQYCYFEVERRLCEILAKSWHPGLEVSELLNEVDALVTKEKDLAARLAERMVAKPQANALSTLQLDEDHT